MTMMFSVTMAAAVVVCGYYALRDSIRDFRAEIRHWRKH